MSCKTGNCKESIFQNQKSIISTPQCQDDCPEEINCNGEIVSSDCVKINANLSCLEIFVNDSLTEALTSVNDKLCDIESGCKVKVSADDACCDYLYNKLTSDNQSISIEILTDEPSGCQKINIETSPSSIVWHDINMTSTFSVIPNYQRPQYSDPDALGRVWFRGSATLAPSAEILPGVPVTFATSNLGTSYRPQFIRTTFNGRVASTTSVNATQVPQILIYPTGLIQIKNSTTSKMDAKSIVCFDSFVIETN